MALVQNTAEGGTHGVVVTTGNSGGGSGTAFSEVVAGVTFSNVQKMHGSLSYAMAGAASTWNVVRLNSTAGLQFTTRVYVYLQGSPSAETNFVTVQTAAGGAVAGLNLATTRILKLVSAGGWVADFTTALSLNTWYRLVLYGTVAASNATVTGKLYAGDSTTPIETKTSSTANTGSTAAGRVYYGKLTQPPSITGGYYFDDLAQDLTSAAEIGSAYDRTPADTAGATDAVTVVATYDRTPADTAGATDTATLARTLTATDTAGATDTDQPQTVDVAWTSDDAAGATDDAVVDFVPGGTTYTLTPADTAGVTDAATVLVVASRTVADAAGATDTAAAVQSVTLTPVDTATGSDAVVVSMIRNLTAADVAGVTDSVDITATGTQSVNPADTAASSDLASVTCDATRVLGDAAAATDTATVTLAASTTTTDSAVGSDAVTVVMSRIVTVDDLLALIDAADGALTGALTPIDTPPCHITVIPAEDRTTVVPTESRLTIVAVETRLTVIAPESRTTVVPAEDRTTRIGACP